MTDLIDRVRAKQRELDDLRWQAREDPDATLRLHRSNTVAHDFGDGESEDTAADLRQQLADVLGVEPESFEDMAADDLRAIVDAEISADNGEREHTSSRSPSADMRGRGGNTRGEPADDEETDAEAAKRIAERTGRGPNGYPIKGREARRKRNSAPDIDGDGYGSNGYPQAGREAWRARTDDRTPTERVEDRPREHAESGDGYGSNGYPQAGREAWRGRGGRTATETGDSDDDGMTRSERERRRRERYG